MKEKIKKMPGRIRNYFCSHMSAQVTVTVVLLLILAGLVLQIYVKNQYFNYLLRNTRSMEESMIETSTINIDANLKDIISAACNVGVNETLRVLVENTEADGILLAKEKLTLGSRMDDIAHQIGSVVSIAIVSDEAHEKGTPVMRPLFYDFPEDKESWNVETEYMFGPKVLVKPITDADARETDVYLPGGASWTNAWTGETFEGGQKVHVAAPIEQIPLFTRDGYKLPMK